MDFSKLPTAKLAHLPTPLEFLPRLTEALGGPQIYIKRDDATGLAFGGNKTRKLEFLLGEALSIGAQRIVTFGALQSNHVRQTAAACARLGLSCHGVLVDRVPYRGSQYRSSGNLLVDDLLGAEIEVVTSDTEAGEMLADIKSRAEKAGERVYVIPAGGSSPIGAAAYAACFDELKTQLETLEIDANAIVLASATGGTHAGMLAGRLAAGEGPEILGVNVYEKDVDRLAERICTLTQDVLLLLYDDSTVEFDHVAIVNGFVGAGYGMPTPEMKEAVGMLATLEGVLIDPVYTGKAMAALIFECRAGRWAPSDRVVFLHTGGAPGLFAYETEFASART